MATNSLEIDQELVSKAAAFQQIAADPRWRPLLDELARFNDAILGQIRALPVGETEKVTELVVWWKHCENYLLLMQNILFGTIEQRNQYIRDVLKNRLPEERIEELLRGGYGNIPDATER